MTFAKLTCSMLSLLSVTGLGVSGGAPAVHAPVAAGGQSAEWSSACPPVEKFGSGLFSTEKWEWRLTFSPNRHLAFWTVSDDFFPVSRESTIVFSEWRGGGWTPATVAPFSGTYTDIDPFITPDGRTLFFSSIRPVAGVERTDLDLWFVRRTKTGWSEPIHLGDVVNSPSDELYPSLDWWGNVYFGSDRGGQWDIWTSRRRHDGTYGPPQRL